MKILLTAINAKYIHSNPALYSLKAYGAEYGAQIEIAEFTINHRLDHILMELYKKNPDVLCFSCYIWNIQYITELCGELSKIAPHMQIWVGGPEVSFRTEAFLLQNRAVFGAMILEGEETFLELCRYYCDKSLSLHQIKGIVYEDENKKLVRTPARQPIDMDRLPFYYQDLDLFKNRIIYYESSRGCPFSCTYCLSSIERSLRFRSLELVKKELKFFLDHQVPQVKFVDRTFNCNHEHAVAIWNFMKENDNGITNFHFEISADLLTEEEITCLAGMRKGMVQFEIGVQSVNQKTIKEIHRTMDLNRLDRAVRMLAKASNIHLHLDLIAGLPYEDFSSFRNSFDEVYKLKPEMLQLGFLKVLKGSYLYEHANEYEMLSHRNPPYEVLATKWISYDQIIKIKMVEEMLEIYYNSGQFPMTVRLLMLSFESSFDMYLRLYEHYEKNKLDRKKHSRITRAEILLSFAADVDEKHGEIYKETLIYDLYARERLKKRPAWAADLNLYKEQIRQFGRKLNVHFEPFYFNFMAESEYLHYPVRADKPTFYMFSYELDNRAVKVAETMERF